MASHISNKHKQAKYPDDSPDRLAKRWTARRLRRDDFDERQAGLHEERATTPGSIDHRALRKKRGHCPVCEAKLEKNGKRTRYIRQCNQCGAVHQKHLVCPSCSTHRVWAGRLGRWCKGCGRPVAR